MPRSARTRSAVDALVVDDDPGVRRAMADCLPIQGFSVRVAASGRAALDLLGERVPDIVLLDVSMPGLDGLEVLRQLRDSGDSVPVCILSARDDVEDRVAGLAAGADDYVVKPFSINELAARMHALVGLHRRRRGRPLIVGDLAIEPDRRVATRGGRDLGLTAREFDLLETFMRHPGLVLSRGQLLRQVWGYDWEVESNVVDVFVGYLRRKLEASDAHRMLHTVRGVGFVLRP